MNNYHKFLLFSMTATNELCYKRLTGNMTYPQEKTCTRLVASYKDNNYQFSRREDVPLLRLPGIARRLPRSTVSTCPNAHAHRTRRCETGTRGCAASAEHRVRRSELAGSSESCGHRVRFSGEWKKHFYEALDIFCAWLCRGCRARH